MNAYQLELFEEYKDFPRKIVYKNFSNQLTLFKDELLAEGDYLLILAINRYNPDKGGKFSSYAYTTIQYGLYEYLDIKLKGYKRKIHKLKGGKTKMETIKPTFISMDNSQTEGGNDIAFNEFHGDEDISYNEIELELTMKKIIDELKELANHNKKYKYCGEILETMVFKPELNKGDICNYLNISSTTMFRKMELLKEYFLKHNYKELLINE